MKYLILIFRKLIGKHKFLIWFCDKYRGHEAAQGELGYSGGSMMDVWCKWCDGMYQIPVCELDIHDKLFKKLMKLVGKTFMNTPSGLEEIK